MGNELFDAKPQPVKEDDSRFSEVSYFTGRAGNAFSVFPFQAQPFFQMQVPAHMSRTWLVNILSLQSTGKLNSGVDLGNQTIKGSQGPRTAASTYYNGDPLRLRLEYGTGDAMETCLLDYPFSGGTFEMTCSTARMFLVNPFPPGAPINATGQNNFYQAVVGAFISAKGLSRGKCLMQPTFTYSPTSIADQGGVSIAIPNRAVGYRLFTDASGAGNDLAVSQALYDGTVVRVDAPTQNQLYPYPFPLGQGNAAGEWYPLDPKATRIDIDNNDGAGQTWVITVQFVLDIG